MFSNSNLFFFFKLNITTALKSSPIMTKRKVERKDLFCLFGFFVLSKQRPEMYQSPAVWVRGGGGPALLSTDLFWPPVRCVVEVDSRSLVEYLGERGWPRKSRGKLASVDFMTLTSQPFHHSGLLLLFSCPSVKESVYQTDFIWKIMIT